MCVILSVLILLGVSSLQYRHAQQSAALLKDALFADVLRIEQMARERHSAIQLCGSQDGVHCQNNWADGMLAIDQRSGAVVAYHHYADKGMLVWSGSLGKQVVLDATGRPSAVQGSWRYRLGKMAHFKLTLLRTGALH